MVRTSSGGLADDKSRSKALLDTLADQIGSTIAQVPGVAKIMGGGKNKTGGSKPAKGIRLMINAGELEAHISLIALFGYPIPEIARRVQRETQDILNGSAMFPVSAVRVSVNKIHFDQTAADYRRRVIEALEEEKPTAPAAKL